MPPVSPRLWTEALRYLTSSRLEPGTANPVREYVHPVQTPEPEPPADDGIPEATINRNWTELIQELRSTQTGVQVLTGFLLTVPFSDRFERLDRVELTAYLLVLSGAVTATAMILSPIAYHRILFRRGQRPWLVETANKVARTGLVLVALTTCGVVFLTFDLAVTRTVGIIASLVALAGYLVLWVWIPMRARPRRSSAARLGHSTPG